MGVFFLLDVARRDLPDVVSGRGTPRFTGRGTPRPYGGRFNGDCSGHGTILMGC